MRRTPIKDIARMMGFSITTIVGYMSILYACDLGRIHLEKMARAGEISMLWPLAAVLGMIVMVFLGIIISCKFAELLFGHPMDFLDKIDESEFPVLTEKQDDMMFKACMASIVLIVAPITLSSVFLWEKVMASGFWKPYASEFVAGLGYPASGFIAVGIAAFALERTLALYYERRVRFVS